MSFILKTDTLFKKQTEDPLKLVQAVCNSNDFRNSFFSPIEKKAWRIGDGEKEHLLETTEIAPFRTMAVSGGLMGQFVSIPVLMNVFLAEKNEHIQKLENKLQEVTENQNTLLQQLEDSKKELQNKLLEESEEKSSVSLKVPEEETTQPILTERGAEESGDLIRANPLPQVSGDAPKPLLELTEVNVQAFLIEKDAEIISLKHEMAALREELHEKETLLKESLKKLEKMHESMVQSQEGTTNLLNVEKDKLKSCMKMGKSENLLSPRVVQTSEIQDITCRRPENQVSGLEDVGKFSEIKDDQKEKHTVLEDKSLGKQLCRMEKLHSDGTSKGDTFIAAAKEQPKQTLEEEKSLEEDSPNILSQKERKLEKEKMYLKKLCSLLIQERQQIKRLIGLDPTKIHKIFRATSKDNSKVFLQKDDAKSAGDESTVTMIKPESDETSVEAFLISLILKDLECALDAKERKGDITEEEDVLKQKVEQHMGQVEANIISNGSTASVALKEKEEGFKILMEEEMTPENSPPLVPLKVMQQKKCVVKSKGEKEESIVKPEQHITKMSESNLCIGDREIFSDATDTDPEEAQMVDNPFLSLQQELESCKKERDALLQRLKYYELETRSDLEIRKSLMQIQVSSPTLLHELQTLRQERDALQVHLRSQALKENNLLLDYDMLKTEYENLQITLQKISIERDGLQLKLNECIWKEKQLDHLRYQAKQSEILRIERDRMKIKLEELAGIEVAYIKLMEKTEKLEKKMTKADHFKERGQGEVKSVKSETCERASQVPDAVLMEDTYQRAAQLPNSMLVEDSAERMNTETCERTLHVPSFMLMEDTAEVMNTGLCKVDAHLMREKATQTSESDMETQKEWLRRVQDITRLQEQTKVLGEHVDKIAVLVDETHQVQTELNQLREEINKHSCAVNDLQDLTPKLKDAQNLEEKASDKVSQDVRFPLIEITKENISLKNEVEKLRNAQLKTREKLARQDSDIKCLQKEFNQLQQVMEKESFRTNQMLKLVDNVEHLQLSDMCEELQNVRFIFQHLMTENTAMGSAISALKETEIQLKNLTTQMDEENLTLGKKVVELQQENVALRDKLCVEQESLRRQMHECDKDILVIKRNISKFSHSAILVKSYKNKLFQLNQENVSLKYKILALKEGMSLKQASSLSEEVKNLNFELNLLHKENASLSERILELSQEKSQLKQFSMLPYEISRLKCEMQKRIKENKQLQQRIFILEKENNILKRTCLSPDEAASFVSHTKQVNEESIDLVNKLGEEGKEMSSREVSESTDNMQALKHEVNRLIQENQSLRERLKNIEAQENLAEKLIKENNSLKHSAVDKADSNTLLTQRLESPHEVKSMATERIKSSQEITLPKSHITQLQEALERLEEKCKYLEDELAGTANKYSSEEVSLLKNHIAHLQEVLKKQEEECKYLEQDLAEKSNKHSSEVAFLKKRIAQLQKALKGQEEKCKCVENELAEVLNKHSSEVDVLKHHIAQLQKSLERQEEKCKCLENKLAEITNQHSSEVALLKNQSAQLQEVLVRREEKCIYLENELAEASNRHSSEQILPLKYQIEQLQEELEEQEEKRKYLENELAKTSNKHPSEEINLLKNNVMQLQKELEGQEEKRQYLESELAETSSKLIECEVKIKLNTETIIDSNDASNHMLENIKKQLLDEQNARELAEEILQYTQYELDRERILTKELQSQVSKLEEEISEEKQLLNQLSESINKKDFKETSETTTEELAYEMESPKAEIYKVGEDKAKLEEVIKCNKLLESENVYLKQCLQECKHLEEHTIENKTKELENLKAENLKMLNKIKSCENQISVNDVELHKLNSEIEHLKEEAKIKSAENILKMGLEIKQKLEETINENNEAAVEVKNLEANFEELKVQISEIREIIPQDKQKPFKIMPRFESTELPYEYGVNAMEIKHIQQQEQKQQDEEPVQLLTIIQSFHATIQELSTKLSETAEMFQGSELKDLEYATEKLETEVKVLKEQLLCDDTATASLIDTCITEKQELLGYFQNIMDELNSIKEYSCGIDILKTNLQQKTEENIQLETTVKKLENENETLRQLNSKKEDKALCALQEVKYVVDCMRRKCQTCAETYDHCTNLLKECSLKEHLSTDHISTEDNKVDWSNKYALLEQELQDVKNMLSNCEKKLQKVTLEKESQKLKSLSLEKELKYFQHKYGRQDASGVAPANTETVKHTIRPKDSTPSKSKNLHSLKQTSSNGDSKDIEKIQEVMQLIERMRRKCRRCAAAYDHCTNLLTQAIAKSAPSSNDTELITLQQKYEELLENKKSVEEELTAEMARVLCLQKEIENMKKSTEEHKLQEHITINNILDAERKKTEELEKELCELKKKYEDSWNLINTQTLRNTKAKASSLRIKKMKVEITQLKKQLKTLQKDELSSDMLNAEREKNLSLQKELENLRKEFEQYKIREQCYIEDMLNAEVQKTVVLEEEVTEWKHKYEACWKLMNTQTSSTTESTATTAHVRAMEAEIVDLKEKLSIYKMERSLFHPQMSVSKMEDSETENIRVLEEELGKLRSRNKELTETVEEMETKHQRETKELKDKIGELEIKLASMSGEHTSDYDEAIANVKLEYQKQIMEKESMYEANIKSLKSSFERDTKNLKKLHDENILRLQKQHDEEMQDINRMHEAELKAISAPTRDEDILQHHNANLRLEIPQRQLQATDSATGYADVGIAEADSKDSLMTRSSSSRSFTNILTKIIQEGINALDFSELSRLHREVCQATSDFVLNAKDATVAELLKSSQDSPDQGQLSKCISVLQLEVIKRQKEAEKKVLYFGMQICKERKRICELREHLRHEKEENLELRNCVGTQSQSIATLKMEKALTQRQTECIKQRLQQYIVLLKKEKAKARLLEEEVSKVKITNKKLENLWEMEKKYSETNETRQALFIESMKMKLDTAIESEAKLRYQLHQKQGFQMAGDAGMTERGVDALEDNAQEL